MNTLKLTFGAFICLGLLQLVSCTKSLDTANDSISLESSSDATVANEFSDCKMRYIYHEHPGISGLMVKGLFTYYKGNPISLTYDYNGTGNPNHYFYYDIKQRLREWRQAYTPTDLVEAVWHKFGYNSSDEVVVDSMFRSGYRTEEGVTKFADTTISILTYDDQGRIIKEAITSLRGGRTRYPTYTYDNRGNLGILGWRSSWYDTKVSFLRSHPLFMFLMRNYSRNNPWNLNSQGQKYNSRGLPLSIEVGNDYFFGAVNIEKIIYDCQ